MKKIFALLLVLLLMLPYAVSADNTDTMQEVLASVKEKIPETENYEKFDSSYDKDETGRTIYSFSWENEDDDSRLRLTVTESGIITSYYQYIDSDENDYKATMNKLSSEEVLPKAQILADALNPSLKGKIIVEKSSAYESLYNPTYSFKVKHIENGIEVSGDSGYINITDGGESIRNFYINYSEDLTYESTEGILDLNSAKKKFKENIGMKLSYKIKYEDKKKTAYLSYTPADGNLYIDAKTGEATKAEIYDVYAEETSADYFKSNKYAAGSDSGAYSQRFSEAEKAEIAKVTDLLSSEEALSIIEKTGLLELPEDVRINLSLNKDYYNPDKYYYSIYYSGDNYWGSAEIDAKSGQIVRLSNYPEYSGGSDKSEKISRAENTKTAYRILSVLCPDEIGEQGSYKIDESRLSEENTGTFIYRRYVNDIPCDNNTITLQLDSKTGKFSYFSLIKDDIEFPLPEDIITKEEAADKLFEAVAYEAIYFPVSSSEKVSRPDKTLLVYKISGNSTEIDAKSGKIVSFYTEKEIPEYTDIKGHYAENAINTLKKFGIGFEDSAYRPDDPITQKDFITLVMSSVTDYSPICIAKEYDASGTYRLAMSSGIVKKEEKNDNAAVTRSEAALYFIRVLGYDEIASIEGIYKTPFNDVTENIGHIALLTGMKVLSGNGDGSFSPQTPLTRGAAAVMIYNYFTR